MSRIAVLALLGLSAVVVAGLAVVSLRWRYVHDSPLMIYAGFLIDRGAVPYRDFFDMNMPGTYFVMWTMGRVFGWTDLAFRLFDLTLLATLSFVTWRWMRRLGSPSAAFAVIGFALQYLGGTSSLSLQREYIALVPLACALWLSCGGAVHSRPTLRALLVGACSAAACLIKPQMGLLCLPVIVYLRVGGAGAPSLVQTAVGVAAGFALPCAIVAVYLAATGSLELFLDIATNYWPLYTHMTGGHRPISGWPRAVYIVETLVKALATAPLLLPAVLGPMVGILDPDVRRPSWLIAGLLLAAALYPAASGQFWPYHWIPLQYAAYCAASLSLRPLGRLSLDGWRPLPVVAGAMSVLLLVAACGLRGRQLIQYVRQPQTGVKHKRGVPDEVSDFLKAHVRPGDTVQPLDWTSGAVHGMLLARVPLGTRFLYDFHFYHHVDSAPYIHRIRREFVAELTAREPRFVVQVLTERARPNGPDTTTSFPELEALLASRYVTAKEGRTYRILERHDQQARLGPTADPAR